MFVIPVRKLNAQVTIIKKHLIGLKKANGDGKRP